MKIAKGRVIPADRNRYKVCLPEGNFFVSNDYQIHPERLLSGDDHVFVKYEPRENLASWEKFCHVITDEQIIKALEIANI